VDFPDELDLTTVDQRLCPILKVLPISLVDLGRDFKIERGFPFAEFKSELRARWQGLTYGPSDRDEIRRGRSRSKLGRSARD
jgi:hypothetical protein